MLFLFITVVLLEFYVNLIFCTRAFNDSEKLHSTLYIVNTVDVSHSRCGNFATSASSLAFCLNFSTVRLPCCLHYRFVVEIIIISFEQLFLKFV